MDGQDSRWQAKRAAAKQALCNQTLDGLAPFSDVAGRYRDNDELRYSLRALQQFFPEHGHVYVVTDQQTPTWLAPNERLSIVDHRDLMPAQHLPTFDSGNIESYIHRIPSLSERFFYLNDDVFFGAPVRLSDWFYDAGIFVAWSDDAAIDGDALCPNATALINASRLSKQWLGSNAATTAAQAGYRHTPRTFAHSPRPMLKSMMLALESTAPELFTLVRSTVFRAWDKPTIVADFALRWALASGFAKVRAHTHVHVSTGDAHASAQLTALSQQFGTLDFFCINDTTDDAESHDARLALAKQTLHHLLPHASGFERVPLTA